MTPWIAGVLTTALLAASPPLSVETQVGLMETTLRGSNGKEVALSRWRGKPIILFYEDRHSTTLNLPLKEALFSRGKELGLLDAAWVIAVANLKSFDFFPARGIALSHVRDEEKKWGIPILVDLKGTLGKAPWNLPTKTSSVLLLDGTGTLVYRYSGRMDAEEQETFFQTLGTLLGQDIPAESNP
jgi:hypothetical protein